MNASRYLFAIPVLFAASITAAACSSSSSPITGVGDGGGTSNPDCATLLVCCDSPSFPAAQKADCISIANAGGAACTTNLSTVTKAGACTTTGTSSSSSVTSSSSTSSSVASTGTGTGSSGATGAATCASPGPVPAGFVGPTGIIGSGCTSAQVTALGQDDLIDGGGSYSTVITMGAPDGSLNGCGTCVQGTILEPGQPTPASWSAEVGFAPEATAGDPMSLFAAFGDGPNFGGCVLAADPVNGKQCGIDLMTITACEFAVCLPVCAVPGGSTNPDFTALSACISAADSTSCASYISALKTDCAALSNDSGTGVFDKCAKLSNIDSFDTEAGVATPTTETDFLGLLCGGADAGI